MISDIIGQYTRHGWRLNRVLLTPEWPLPANANDIFGDAEVRAANINAMWFARRSRPDEETWELRLLSRQPYALLAFLPDMAGEAEREAILEETVDRMLERALGPTEEAANGKTFS